MKTFAKVAEWCIGAAKEFGDPGAVVCQLFFRWQEDMTKISGPDLMCGMVDGGTSLALVIHPNFAPIPLQVDMTGAKVDDAGEALLAYGIQPIDAGVWALEPSLNIEGVIHGFVVLYGVPDPAPWERRIVLLR